jgi:hypothetical protein
LGWFRAALQRPTYFHVAVMFDRNTGNEREHNENDQALLARRKHKYRQEPLHRVA